MIIGCGRSATTPGAIPAPRGYRSWPRSSCPQDISNTGGTIASVTINVAGKMNRDIAGLRHLNALKRRFPGFRQDLA